MVFQGIRLVLAAEFHFCQELKFCTTSMHNILCYPLIETDEVANQLNNRFTVLLF